MSIATALLCDGCGQLASPEHIARRLERLEWSTRYRPLHIKTLLLGAFSPPTNREFLYAPIEADKGFEGEALQLFDAAAISVTGKTVDTIHSEFQRLGLFLTHVLECPLEKTDGNAAVSSLLAQHAPAVATRIRRSLKPKRVVLISAGLAPVLDFFSAARLLCPVATDNGAPFQIDDTRNPHAMDR